VLSGGAPRRRRSTGAIPTNRGVRQPPRREGERLVAGLLGFGQTRRSSAQRTTPTTPALRAPCAVT
jgi:hypothetical protein